MAGERKDPKTNRFTLKGTKLDSSEIEFRAAFKLLTPEKIAAALSPELRTSPPASHLINAHPLGDLREHLYSPHFSVPLDVIYLSLLYSRLDNTYLIKDNPEIFRQIVGKPEANVASLLHIFRFNEELDLGTKSLIGPATVIAFIQNRQEHRGSIHNMFLAKSLGNPFETNRHLIEATPDLSDRSTPEERLDGVIDMFSLTHEEALARVCLSEGVDLTNLRDCDEDMYRQVHRRAGLMLASISLYYALVDCGNAGTSNVFRRREDPITGMGQCPAASFIGHWLTGVGLAMRENREALLEAMRS